MKHVMFLVMGKRQTVESTTMEAVRDGLIEVFPWAHNATVGDDYVWPEVGQQQKSTSKREVALRIVWIESVLRLALAAKHGEERLVRHLSARGNEVAESEDAEAASRVIRDVATTPADAGAIQIKFGTAVMEAHVAMIAATNALTGETDYEEMRRSKMVKTLVMKLARKLRNAVAEDVSFSSVPCLASTVPFPMTPPYVGGTSSFLNPSQYPLTLVATLLACPDRA